MAIYRRSSRRPLVIVAAVAAIAGLALGFVAGRATAPDLAGQVHAARAEAAPILTSLEVVRTEYPKLLSATAGADPGGAASALAQARATFTAHAAELRILDPTGTSLVDAALAKVETLVGARAAQSEVSAAIDSASGAVARLTGGATS